MLSREFRIFSRLNDVIIQLETNELSQHNLPMVGCVARAGRFAAVPDGFGSE